MKPLEFSFSVLSVFSVVKPSRPMKKLHELIHYALLTAAITFTLVFLCYIAGLACRVAQLAFALGWRLGL